MRSLGLSVLLALATVACGANGDGADEDGGTDLHGGVTQDQADEAMAALCDIAEGRVTEFDEIQAAFNNRAHETLHHVAAVAEEVDPASAGALLEAKSVVEADLEQDEAPPELAAHAAALAGTTAAAIRAIGLPIDPCSG
jgi:hypothetical protein